MTKLPLRSLYCALLLARLIRRRNIQLVYINGPRCLVAGALAARLAGRPSVFHLHLTMTRQQDIFVVTRAAKHVTRILTCSKTTAAALLAGHPEFNGLVQVIYNPVRLSTTRACVSPPTACLQSDQSNARDLVVGVVGRVTPQKGQHVVLDAVSELARRGRNVRVVLVGAVDPHSPEDNSYLGSLKSTAKAAGLERQICWAGYQDDPMPFYTACDVVAIPSTVSEGLPMVALEAMRLGVPVIGANVGGIPEIVREGVNGFLFPPRNAVALADCVQRVWDDRGLLVQLKVGALETVDGRFSIENFRADIRRVLADCAQD